jgi:hypothetical protein
LARSCLQCCRPRAAVGGQQQRFQSTCGAAVALPLRLPYTLPCNWQPWLRHSLPEQLTPGGVSLRFFAPKAAALGAILLLWRSLSDQAE